MSHRSLQRASSPSRLGFSGTRVIRRVYGTRFELQPGGPPVRGVAGVRSRAQRGDRRWAGGPGDDSPPVARRTRSGGAARPGLGGDEGGGDAFEHDGAVDHALGDVGAAREVVHDLEEHLLEDRPQPTGTRPPFQRLLADGLEGIVGEDEVDVVELEELLVLLQQRVLRLDEDADERLLVEAVHRADHRQAADELGDQPELQQVLGQHVGEDRPEVLLLRLADVRPEADAVVPDPALDDLVDAGERAPAEEEDVRRVDLDELLVRVLAPALRGHRRRGALEDLQQRLLDALTRHVARDRRVLGLARDLVDLVDVDDAGLGLLDVVVRRLDELEEDVLDVLADVARLGERGGVGDRERDLQQAGERLREQRLPAPGRADEQDVALLQLDVGVAVGPRLDALVVVVDGDGQDLLRLLLPDDVVVEVLVDLTRLREVVELDLRALRQLLLDDLVAEIDALVADVDAGTGDELLDLLLALPAERALQQIATVTEFGHDVSSLPPPVRRRLAHAGGRGHRGELPVADDFVDDPVVLCLDRAHDEVAVGVVRNLLDGLVGVVRHDLVEELARPDDLLGLDLDVDGLAGCATVGLVDQDARVRERVALAVRARRQQHRRRRRGLADADRLHVRLDVLHRVVDREQRRDLAPGRVDVHGDVLVGVFALEMQQLGDHQVRDRVVDRRAEEDDALLEQPGVDVEGTLAAVGLLDDRGDEVVADGLDFAHAWGSSVFALDDWSSDVCSSETGGSPSGTVKSRGFPASSTTSAWSTRNRAVFPLAMSERTASRMPLRSRSRRTFLGFSSRRSANRSTSSFSSSSVASMPSCAATARNARSARTARSAVSRTCCTNACSSVPVAARYCWSVTPWPSSRCAMSCRRCSISRCTSASDRSIVTSSATASSTLSRAATCACTVFTSSRRLRMSARSSSAVSNSLTSDAHSSVTSGSTLRFVSLTSTWNATSSPARSANRSGRVSLNFRMSPGRLPASSTSSLGTSIPEPTSYR